MGKSRRKRDGSWRAPEALRRLRAALTEERKLREFRQMYGRDPSCEDELEVFIKNLTLEMYNAGFDDWPPEEPEQPE